MIIIRLLFIAGFLVLVLFFALNRGGNFYLPPSLSSYLGQIKGLASAVPKIQNLPQNPQEVKDLLQSAGSNSAVKAMVTPLLNEGQKTLKNAQSDILAQLPRLIEIVTNSKKEELYLVSPQSLIIPKVSNTESDQEISIQLDQFEVKDSRKSKTPWSLVINAKPSNGTLSNSDISFKLKKENIQAIEGSSDGLTVEDGNRIRISVNSGSGKGIYRFRPYLVVKINKGVNLENSRIEIESSFE